MTTRLEELARAHTTARRTAQRARKALAEANAEVKEIKPQLDAEIVAEAKRGTRQTEIVRITGLTRERIRQICREAGVQPADD